MKNIKTVKNEGTFSMEEMERKVVATMMPKIIEALLLEGEITE